MALRPAWLPTNENGGFYEPGKKYGLPKKLEVFQVYMELTIECFPDKPSIRDLAKRSKVGRAFASQIIKEVDQHGGVLDPEDIRQHRIDQREGRTDGVGCRSLSPEHEAYILALHAENPSRPLRKNLFHVPAF